MKAVGFERRHVKVWMLKTWGGLKVIWTVFEIPFKKCHFVLG